MIRSRRRSSTVRRAILATAVIVVALTTTVATGAPPEEGVLVPGKSLGGVRLGWTLAQVERIWGTSSGRCRDCVSATRYFNRIPFRPEGAGVTLRDGVVSSVFTLWAPRSWHTNRGLYIGEPEARVTRAHGRTSRVRCRGYDALVLQRRQVARTAVYLVDDTVWGFGLLGEGEPICR